MIPAFSHCPDCGTPPDPISPPWSMEDGNPIGFWCRLCKLLLLMSSRDG